MRILQALPALHSGGVERGTVEFAAELVKRGHESFVVSRGGPMAEQLRGQGSTVGSGNTPNWSTEKSS